MKRRRLRLTDMNTPPHRIALGALVLLLLAAAFAWWRTSKPAEVQGARPEKAPQVEVLKRGKSSREADLIAWFFRSVGTDGGEQQAYDDCGQATKRLVNERGKQISERSDAHSKLAYALTAWSIEEQPANDGKQSGKALRQQYDAMQVKINQQVEQAWLQGPDDPQARWLAMMRCTSQDTCMRVDAALTQAEPNNTVVWLQVMEHAQKRGDRAAMADAFAHAAAASDYEGHVGSTALLVVDAYKDLPTPESCLDPRVQRFAQAIGFPGLAVKPADVVAGMARFAELPPVSNYTALQGYCATSEILLEDSRRSACGRIYTLMADNDMSAMGQRLAIRNAIQLTEGEPEQAQWRERYRQHQWLIEHYANGVMMLDPLDAALDEMGAVRTRLQAEDKWPPAANWLPDDKYNRSLIQTGRPPPEVHH